MEDAARERAHLAWRRAERIKQLSDGLIKAGPLGIGLDAVIDWTGVGGPLYSAGAGGLLIYEAVAAEAAPATIGRMAAYLLLDTATSSVPVAGWIVDAFFRGHRMAARALQRDIEKRHGPAQPPQPLRPFRWSRRRPA